MIIFNGWILMEDVDHTLIPSRPATWEEVTDYTDILMETQFYAQRLAIRVYNHLTEMDRDVRRFFFNQGNIDSMIKALTNKRGLKCHWKTIVETLRLTQRIVNCETNGSHDFKPIPTTTLDHCICCGAIRDTK